MSKSELYSALVKAQSEFESIPKNKEASIPTKKGSSYKYKYADLPSIIESTTPHLNRNGLAVIQILRDGCLVTKLVHSSGESEESSWAIPTNLSPQDLGKYMTYLRRYQMNAMLDIAPEDDDDGAHATYIHKTSKASAPINKSLERATALLGEVGKKIHGDTGLQNHAPVTPYSGTAADYVIQTGSNKGKKVSDIDREKLKNWYGWACGKDDLPPLAVQAREQIEKYLSSDDIPSFDQNEEIPF